MVLQSSGPIKFSQLQNEFNTGAPLTLIKFSHYYVNSDHSLNTYGVPGIPSKNNPIKLSQFYSKTVFFQNLVKNGNNVNIITNNTYTFNYNSQSTHLIKINDIGAGVVLGPNIFLVGGGGASIPGLTSFPVVSYGGGGGQVCDIGNVNFLIGATKTVYTIVIGNGGYHNNGNGGSTYIINNNTNQILNNFFERNGGANIILQAKVS